MESFPPSHDDSVSQRERDETWAYHFLQQKEQEKEEKKGPEDTKGKIVYPSVVLSKLSGLNRKLAELQGSAVLFQQKLDQQHQKPHFNRTGPQRNPTEMLDNELNSVPTEETLEEPSLTSLQVRQTRLQTEIKAEYEELITLLYPTGAGETTFLSLKVPHTLPTQITHIFISLNISNHISFLQNLWDSNFFHLKSPFILAMKLSIPQVHNSSPQVIQTSHLNTFFHLPFIIPKLLTP
eukprot:TRINITY_DN1750_c0_g5_i1.p1 TRINITY_DN1750_c0_g5~~TRINITY_DN1750_c0_g5_i1.p1  ORF type:complete len:237 (-),score=48.96 TRINITY_DN1750_c0_g5_i1:275-985(-)